MTMTDHLTDLIEATPVELEDLPEILQAANQTQEN